MNVLKGGEVTCSRSHSWKVAESGIKLKLWLWGYLAQYMMHCGYSKTVCSADGGDNVDLEILSDVLTNE